MPQKTTKLSLSRRPRRLRRNPNLRAMIAETTLETRHFVEPLFLVEGKKRKEAIKTLPGLSRLSLDTALTHIEESLKLGVKSFALFPAVPENKKNSLAKEALNPKGLAPQAIREIKKRFPEVVLFSDIALDPYSSAGHDGIVRNGEVLNDETVEILAKMAIVHAEAGVDFVAPSDMMDGRIGAIRQRLDQNDHQSTGILAYSAKYASGFYGPFRDALDSAPKKGDKKTYQMDYRNTREALLEVELDINEGADIVMVKPALSYLDVISQVKLNFPVPVAAYNVSGEYAMVHAAAERGMLNLDQTILEILTSIRRAGADLIFTYHAQAAAKLLVR